VALAGPSDPPQLTVGELARRIWREARREGEPNVELTGIRRGETLSEVIVSPDEEIGREERFPGIAPIAAEIPTAAPAWIAERLPSGGGREESRVLWREAMERPGLLSPTEPRARREA